MLELGWLLLMVLRPLDSNSTIGLHLSTTIVLLNQFQMRLKVQLHLKDELEHLVCNKVLNNPWRQFLILVQII